MKKKTIWILVGVAAVAGAAYWAFGKQLIANWKHDLTAIKQRDTAVSAYSGTGFSQVG